MSRRSFSIKPRISHVIYGAVVLLVAVIFLLAQGHYEQLDAIEQDFSTLERVSQTSRLAADLGERLVQLTSAIREYLAADAIEPPKRVGDLARELQETAESGRGKLAKGAFEIDRVRLEVARYLASFDTIVTARRQRQQRLARLADLAERLSIQAAAARQTERYLRLRQAEFAFLLDRRSDRAARVVDASRTLSALLKSAQAIDIASEYALAFGRVVEIYDVLDQATVLVLSEHDQRLRALTAMLGQQALVGERAAVGDFRARLATAVQRNIEVSIVAVLVALLGATLLLRFVLLPLNRMTGAMTAVAQGSYARTIPYSGRRDEIGEMSEALTTFKNALLELRAAQAQAETASRHKSEFLANMSHELRTPLNAIIGLSEMLLEEAAHPDTTELAESLTRIGVSSRHLLGLINDILDLSRIEAGRMPIHLEPFAPAALAKEALATVARLADKKGIGLEVHCAPGLPSIDSDAQRVRQMLINLLGNAIKFTDTGRVVLDVSVAEGMLLFAVSDTGAGIAAEHLARLFQDFSQIDNSSTRKHGGTGLGLAISRRMARLLGGDIAVQSKPGQGSRFTISLPLTLPPAVLADERMPGEAALAPPRDALAHAQSAVAH